MIEEPREPDMPSLEEAIKTINNFIDMELNSIPSIHGFVYKIESLGKALKVLLINQGNLLGDVLLVLDTLQEDGTIVRAMVTNYPYYSENLVVTIKVMSSDGSTHVTCNIPVYRKFYSIAADPDSNEEMLYIKIKHGRDSEKINPVKDYETSKDEFIIRLQELLANLMRDYNYSQN